MRLLVRGGLLAFCIGAILLCPIRPVGITPAEAASTICARHYPGGAAPDITRPTLR